MLVWTAAQHIGTLLCVWRWTNSVDNHRKLNLNLAVQVSRFSELSLKRTILQAADRGKNIVLMKWSLLFHPSPKSHHSLFSFLTCIMPWFSQPLSGTLYLPPYLHVAQQQQGGGGAHETSIKFHAAGNGKPEQIGSTADMREVSERKGKWAGIQGMKNGQSAEVNTMTILNTSSSRIVGSLI